MLVIKLDKELNDFELERLGNLYKDQVEQEVIVLPKGATIEHTSLKPCLIVAEEVKPLTWREKLFGRNLLEVEEVKFIDKNDPVKPKPPGN